MLHLCLLYAYLVLTNTCVLALYMLISSCQHVLYGSIYRSLCIRCIDKDYIDMYLNFDLCNYACGRQ